MVSSGLAKLAIKVNDLEDRFTNMTQEQQVQILSCVYICIVYTIGIIVRGYTSKNQSAQ